MKVHSLQFRVYSLGFKVQGSRVKLWSLGLQVEEAEGLGFEVYSLGFTVQG